MEKLVWHTEQRKVSDLVKLSYNPRKRNEKKQKELEDSLNKFNLVDTPVVNLDNSLISGERRLEDLLRIGVGSEIRRLDDTSISAIHEAIREDCRNKT